MEKGYFEQRKSKILGKIEQAIKQGDSQSTFEYARMLLNLETEYKRSTTEEAPDIKRVNFGTSRWEI